MWLVYWRQFFQSPFFFVISEKIPYQLKWIFSLHWYVGIGRPKLLAYVIYRSLYIWQIRFLGNDLALCISLNMCGQTVWTMEFFLNGAELSLNSVHSRKLIITEGGIGFSLKFLTLTCVLLRFCCWCHSSYESLAPRCLSPTWTYS